MIQDLDIKLIKPYEKNAKRHPQKQVDKIANSIKEFGFLQPVVVDKDMNLIVGHGRYLAALQLNLVTIPGIVAKDLDEAKAKAYRLADNKLNESEWVMDFVIEELTSLEGIKATELDIDLVELTGINLQEFYGDEVISAEGEWAEGMPEFNQKDQTAYRQILISFDNDEDIIEFAKLLQQKISDKTRYLWYPKKDREVMEDKAYL